MGIPRTFRVLLAFVLLDIAQTSFAHTSAWSVCAPTKTQIVIDGELSEWTAPPISVGPQQRSFGAVRDAEDASFTWRATWDTQFLYLAAEVVDDHFRFEHVRDKIYENDCVEVCIDALNDSANTYGADDFQFVFSPSGPDGKPQKWLFRNPVKANLDPPEVRFAACLRQKGYVIEVAIPWAMLGAKPRPRMAIGFNVDIRDYDPKQEVKGLSWSGKGDVCADPMLWGDLILVSADSEEVHALVQELKKSDEARRAKLARMYKPEETENSVVLSVSPESVSTLTLGMGWNWVNRVEELWDWDESTWNAFFELMRWTGCHWVRYGVFGDQWEPTNDDADPTHFNWTAFTFNSPTMQQHHRAFDFCEKAGIDVLVCNWSPPRWLHESTREGAPKPDSPKKEHNAPYDTDEFIENIAALIHHLKVVKKYECVKYISLWNEPNWSYRSATKTYPETFWTYYVPLDKKLREMGLRQKVGILGPDTSTGGKSLGHFIDMLKLHGPLLDVIADHDYDDYLEYKPHKPGTPMSQGVAAYEQLARDVRALYGRRVPVAITEFGNYGNGSRDVDQDHAVFEGALSTAELVLRLANVGLDGFLRWEFRVYGASWRNFGALTETDPTYLFKPYGPVYYPASLLGRYVDRGATLLRTEIEGGRDENGTPRVVAAAFKLPEGHATVLVVNDGFREKELTLRLPIAHLRQLHYLFCAEDEIHSLRKAEDVPLSEGVCKLTLRPRSITALTTLERGTRDEDITVPMKLAVRRQEPKYGVDKKTGQRFVEFAFEHTANWHMWKNSEGKSSFTRSTEQSHEGRYSGKYTYDFTLPQREQMIPGIAVQLVKKPAFISLWVYGDGSGHELSLILVDSKGESFQRPLAPVTWTGWLRVDRKLDDMPKGWGRWGKDADGIVDLPIVRMQLPLTESDRSGRKKGVIFIDEVRVIEE